MSAAEVLAGTADRNAEIRRRVAAGENQAALGREFGVSTYRVRVIAGLVPKVDHRRIRAEAAAYRRLVREGKASRITLDGDGRGGGGRG